MLDFPLAKTLNCVALNQRKSHRQKVKTKPQSVEFYLSKLNFNLQSKMTKKKPLGVGLSKEERMVIVIGEIIQELLKAHDDKKDVNLNRLKAKIASKYGLESSPRLVDIISAVPHESKKVLLPKLKAKPIRTGE